MLGLVLATVVAASLSPGSSLSVDPAASTIRFHVVHKLHRVDGLSSALEGRVVVKEDGRVLAMVRIPVATFQSGDANRDAHMLEALDVGRHPFVVFKGLVRLGATGQLASGPATMEGELDFHGVKRPVTVPLSLDVGANGAVRARGAFDVSLDAHGVERPSLLFVKIDDTCRIDVDLLLREERR